MDAIRRQNKYDKKRKKEYEKKYKNKNKDNHTVNKINKGDKVLIYIGDRYVGNQRKLQPQFDDKIWIVMEIKSGGNLVRLKNDNGKIKNMHISKIKKIKVIENDNGKNDNVRTRMIEIWI